MSFILCFYVHMVAGFPFGPIKMLAPKHNLAAIKESFLTANIFYSVKLPFGGTAPKYTKTGLKKASLLPCHNNKYY